MTTAADLQDMTRAQLDELAINNGLDPADYSNKQDVIDALVAVGTHADEPTPETTTDDDAEPDQEEVDPDAHYEGEVGPKILTGYWVRLAPVEEVPEELQGHLAQIVSSPWTNAVVGVPNNSGIPGYNFDEEAPYLVQTRDEHNSLIEVSEDGFLEYGENRVDVHA